jgi:hypothetical protein
MEIRPVNIGVFDTPIPTPVVESTFPMGVFLGVCMGCFFIYKKKIIIKEETKTQNSTLSSKGDS